jgi:hypothetical protein
VNDYPVLREIESYGFVFFKLDEVSVLDRFLRVPDNNHFETNLNVAREHFNVKDLPRRLSSLLKLDESDVRESVDTPQLRC